MLIIGRTQFSIITPVSNLLARTPTWRPWRHLKFSFDVETKQANRVSRVLIGSPNVNRVSGVLIGSPNVNRVSGVLIGSPNIRLTRVLFWFCRKWSQTERTSTVCKSFWTVWLIRTTKVVFPGISRWNKLKTNMFMLHVVNEFSRSNEKCSDSGSVSM